MFVGTHEEQVLPSSIQVCRWCNNFSRLSYYICIKPIKLADICLYHDVKNGILIYVFKFLTVVR